MDITQELFKLQDIEYIDFTAKLNPTVDPETYTSRYGIRILMTFYLDKDFEREYLDLPLAIETEEYYLRMMIAWFYATALAKQWDATIPIIEAGRLERWTHNKTIQKAMESLYITVEQKEYLKSLKK